MGAVKRELMGKKKKVSLVFTLEEVQLRLRLRRRRRRHTDRLSVSVF